MSLAVQSYFFSEYNLPYIMAFAAWVHTVPGKQHPTVPALPGPSAGLIVQHKILW